MASFGNPSRVTRRSREYLLRSQNKEGLVALKVADMEGENPAESVNHHSRYQTGVVGVLSLDLILDHQLLPLWKDNGSIIQERKKRFEPREYRSFLKEVSGVLP